MTANASDRKSVMNDEDKKKDEAAGEGRRDSQAPAPANDDTDATIEALQAALREEAGHSRVEELEAENAELKDRMLRAVAEAENTRRRAEREREDIRKYAVSKFAEDMLAVADNLGRALDHVPADARANEAVSALYDGVELTMKDLKGALERHGIVAVEAKGARFDPNLHQAVYEAETDEAEPGTVVQVLRTGYTIHGRLLRPAMVAVARAAAPKPDGGAGNG